MVHRLPCCPLAGACRLVRAHDQTITLLTQTLRECPPSSKDGSHQLGRCGWHLSCGLLPVA